MTTTENSVVAIPPPVSPTICPFSFNILLFKENLSEFQPFLENGYLVSRTLETTFLSVLFEKFPGEACPQTPLEAGAFSARKALAAPKKKRHVRCCQEHIRYFTKLSKTLL